MMRMGKEVGMKMTVMMATRNQSMQGPIQSHDRELHISGYWRINISGY